MKNLKPCFFEMILEEPILQLRLSIETGMCLELIEELAESQTGLLAMPRCARIIYLHHKGTIPDGQDFCIQSMFTENEALIVASGVI